MKIKVSDPRKSKELLLSHIEYLSKIRKALSKDSSYVLKSKVDLKEIEMLEQTLHGISILFRTEEMQNTNDGSC